jgi:solute carrier family 13 (sodium-dependent dicarboxylate transporter), member 2/3/5
MAPPPSRRRLRWIGLAAGPLAALATYALLPASAPAAAPLPAATAAAPLAAAAAEGLPHAGRAAASVAAWMAVWWLTEAVEVPVTALLPLALFPLTGATTMKEAAAPYAQELIFLFLGGFVLALSMQRWGLDRRIALAALRLTGNRPANVVGGLMLATAGLSMWVSNTATAAMMLPIALSVIERSAAAAETPGGTAAGDRRNFPRALLLGIAYAASIGGMGTLIGTPPNLFLASYARETLGVEISFARWLGIGLPLVAVFLPLAWWLLTRFLYPVGSTELPGGALGREALAALGPLRRGEWATLAVFAATAGLWIFRPLLTGVTVAGHQPLAGLTDAGIAVAAAISLFVVPVDARRGEFVMDWEHARRLPWGVLLLFGGGLSLGSALESGGVAAFLGRRFAGLSHWPPLAFLAVVAALVIALTEVTSNTATAVTLIPILAAVAPNLGLAPLALAVLTALAASCAFMLPVATPPNAIVFGSGQVTIPEMARAGWWLNLIAVTLLLATVEWLALPLLVGT